MEIITDRKIKYLEYKDVIHNRSCDIRDGVIISVQDLISPMRSMNNTGLSDREPHLLVQTPHDNIFIPVVDITVIIYA